MEITPSQFSHKMGTILPFQPGMKLGRTFDIQNLQTGIDIFTNEAITESLTTEKNETSIQYSVIKSSKDVNKLLGLERIVSLKVKAGILQIDGLGAYLTEYRPDKKAVDILIRAHCETIKVTLSDESDMKANWTENVVGSHYIRSITYGGNMLVKIRLLGSNSRESEHIQKEVEARFQSEGSLDDDAKSKLQQMEKQFGYKLEVSSYAAPLQGTVPQSIEGILTTLESFMDQVIGVNKGEGVPLTCELRSLDYLDQKACKIPTGNLLDLDLDNPPQVQQDSDLDMHQQKPQDDSFEVLGDKNMSPEGRPMELQDQQMNMDVQLEKLENAYDDVLQAKAKLKVFLKRQDIDMNDEQEKRAAEIENRLDNILTVFNSVIVQLDVLPGGEESSGMAAAFETYGKTPGGYQTMVEEFLGSVHPPVQVFTPQRELPSGKQLNLVLIGKTGHGKSATGNTVLDEDLFKSELSSSPVTQYCQVESRRVGGRGICLVDTPGSMTTIYSTDPNSDLGTAISLTPDGCSTFLLVINLHARYTLEEKAAIMILLGGEILRKYTVLVFTFGNDLYSQQRSEGKMMFRDFIKSNYGDLARLLDMCQQRCVLIDNTEEDPRKRRAQVIELVQVIDSVQGYNRGANFTFEMFQLAKERKEDEEKERQRIEREMAEAGELDVRQATRPEHWPEDERILVGGLEPHRQIDYGCFSGNVDVMLESGEYVKMRHLQVGDKVISSLCDGRMEFTEVYFFSHRDEEAIGTYIRISTATRGLNMTPEHHLYLVSGDHRYTVPAGKVRIGDIILVANTESLTLEEDVVTTLTTSTEVGVYAPLTMSGTIIASDILASCYVDHVSPPLSHILLWPVRQLYRLCPALFAWINTPGKNGMPSWVRWCMENVILPYRKRATE